MGAVLTTGIVRILKPDGTTAGTGFVVTDEGLVATCAHVVTNAGAGPGEAVRIIFHHTGDEATAPVEPDDWCDPNKEDIAVLRLDGPLPQGVKPLPLGHSRDVSGHRFKTYSFPDAGDIEGLWGYGMLGDPTTIAGQSVLQLTGTTEVTPGFSGAPVWDETAQWVVGMVTAITPPDAYGRLGETAFVTPTEILVEACPTLRERVIDRTTQTYVDWSSHPPTSFRSRIRRFREEYLGSDQQPVPFGGRRKELAELDAWLTDPKAPPYLLLAAPAGRGKSAFLFNWFSGLRKQADIHAIFVPVSIRFQTNQQDIVFTA